MIHRKIKWDVKLTFARTNACHEVGIDATIMQKEKGANSLPEAYFCSPSNVDTTCVKILHGRKMSDVEQTAHAFLEQQGRRKSQCKIKRGCQ